MNEFVRGRLSGGLEFTCNGRQSFLRIAPSGLLKGDLFFGELKIHDLGIPRRGLIGRRSDTSLPLSCSWALVTSSIDDSLMTVSGAI